MRYLSALYAFLFDGTLVFRPVNGLINDPFSAFYNASEFLFREKLNQQNFEEIKKLEINNKTNQKESNNFNGIE